MKQQEKSEPATQRPCWQNCEVPAGDQEIDEIDAMEDALHPLDQDTVRIRALITGFELCYHEAVDEAERIVRAIGSGRCPEPQEGRPVERQRALESARDLLQGWCRDPDARPVLKVGTYEAAALLEAIGTLTPLKRWQVERMIERLEDALNGTNRYRWLSTMMSQMIEEEARAPTSALDRDHLEKTRRARIRDSVDGESAEISLALAIDLFMPCHWDFSAGLATLLGAVGGNLRPARPYACCARNVRLSPLYDRVRCIAETLGRFWREEAVGEHEDRGLLRILGDLTPRKRWLVASFDKTLRLHLEAAPDFWMKGT